MKRSITAPCCLGLTAFAPACLEESLLGPDGTEDIGEGVDDLAEGGS